MEIKVSGVIKVIGKKEFSPSRKPYPGKVIGKIGLLIETAPKKLFCAYLPSYYRKEDKTLLIGHLGLSIGDRVECLVSINSRPWTYTFITNIFILEILKISE
jgi:hypothetical protein